MIALTLAREQLRALSERLASLPHPLRPLVVRLPLPAGAQLHVLVIGAAPVKLSATRGATLIASAEGEAQT